ncbi:MAG: hypothetical protein A2Y57_01175 [Candidatus Woykebacteria bacterium RBG_13_40_7b]|uniref:Response regulatory domain-containing protein n=1 Tax=Candidatus Woykebacteria bacterium RBG_13_40_7b TaxID=1802594 RepID=A0A1G1WB34_9BACT|nr:MAG: hypothetical protein A2Y57_01175 [Candidatus Woykebacteria bacterium RBG_13_40_7b]
MNKILIIEDDEFVRDLYKNIFQKRGYEVEATRTGEEGFMKAAGNSFDMILLDISLPKASGIEILEKLKTEGKTKKISVFMLTNQSQEEVVKEAFAKGAEGYIVKARMLPEQVVSEVENFLKTKKDHL